MLEYCVGMSAKHVFSIYPMQYQDVRMGHQNAAMGRQLCALGLVGKLGELGIWRLGKFGGVWELGILEFGKFGDLVT